MENEKMEGVSGALGVDISVVLDLLVIGSIDEAAFMLKSYMETNEPDGESELARICIELRAGELIKYIEGDDVAPTHGDFDLLCDKMADILAFEAEYLNSQGSNSLSRFLGDYLAAALRGAKVSPERFYAFLNMLEDEQRKQQVCLAYTLSGASAVAMLQNAFYSAEVLGFCKRFVSSLYAVDKAAYGREAFSLGRYYLGIGNFAEAKELLNGASYHLEDQAECRYLILLAALEAKNDEEFVHSSKFSRAMPEYVSLLRVLHGKPELMKHYTDLAVRNLSSRAEIAPSAPKKAAVQSSATAAAAAYARTTEKKKKKHGCLIGFLITALCVVLLGQIPTLFRGVGCAEMQDYAYDGFEIYEDGLMMTYCTDLYFNGDHYEIPGEVGGRTVLAIGENALNNVNIRSVYIPSTVKRISEGAFTGAEGLESFEVSEHNHYFKTIDGVLYSKDGSELLAYPASRADGEFIVPKHVSAISSYAFYQPRCLESVYIPETVEYAYYCAFVDGWLTVYLESEETPAGFSNNWANNVSFVCKETMPNYSRVGAFVYFGEYPQSLKSADVTVYENIVDERGYYLGSDGFYYAKVAANAYAYDNVDRYFSNGEIVYSNMDYYFKVEPLRWRILSESYGEVLVVCDSVIDTSVFGYTNNYKDSVLREFLLESFLPIAFTDTEEKMIYTSYVENGQASAGGYENPYLCEDTEDKVFLLSFDEATNYDYGFMGEHELDRLKERYATDYAVASGANTNATGACPWWLRSPYYAYECGVAEVLLGGAVSYYTDSSSYGRGVVPALRLNTQHQEHNYQNGVCTECGDTVYVREENYVYMGEFPQSLKADDVEILSSDADERGYYLGSDGEYYVKVVGAPYGFEAVFTTGKLIEARRIYYFKVEPIRWRILTDDGGSALLLCDSILTGLCFDESSNNYQYSDIREVLNGDFYEIAFNREQQSIIYTNWISNSSLSTGMSYNPYICDDTYDKIFLLSTQEVTNSLYGFSPNAEDYDEARRLLTTDYARATGAAVNTSMEAYYGMGGWWLRSPSDQGDLVAQSVAMGGYVDVGNVYYLYNGIAPAMWIGINHTHETVSYREEERIEASCDSEGGYYLVEFCAGCGKENSREWVSIAAKHTFDGDFSCSKCGETAEYYREGNYIYFGEYPQSLKADDVEILSDMTDSRGYYLGSDGYYYAKVCTNPYDGNYFYSTGTSVQGGVYHYFKVEPIRWRILNDAGESVMIICDMIVDAQAYDSSYNWGNAYESSTIRAWLNETFYQTAFSSLQKQIILTSLVDNGVYSTGFDWNNNASMDTEDKIFLLSFAEAYEDWGATAEDFAEWRRITTDYARANGAYMNTETANLGGGYWWLRSPDRDSWASVRVIGEYGAVEGAYNSARDSHIGVVPVLWMHLEHTPLDAVMENYVEGSCESTYDNVSHCEKCEYEISRESVTILYPGHDYNGGFECVRCGCEAEYYTDGEYIYFGEFPQSLKADGVEILSDATDSRGYYYGSDGYYYAKVVASPYGSDYTFSSGTSVIGGEVYYFRVEPIRWRILSTDRETALLMCDSILTNQRFDDSSNNYKESEIRAWLNATFYETAFNELQREIILTTTVDNSAYSTGYDPNSYTCEDTEDKVFLLSYREVTNAEYGFSPNSSNSDPARQLQTSDYSRASGAYMNTSTSYYGIGYWWLRSPHYNYSNLARLVNIDGYVNASSNVLGGDLGVVPALQIRL